MVKRENEERMAEDSNIMKDINLQIKNLNKSQRDRIK